MSRVLVTGATTPVGAALIDRLAADDRVRTILALGVEPASQAARLERHEKVAYRSVNLTRLRRVQTLFFGKALDLGVDTVFHLAMHRRARDEGRGVHALNVEATRELLALCERHPTIQRFIFRSFAEVYDVHPNRPSLIAEDHPLNLDARAPQWIRDRVAADLTVCTRMGVSPLSILVLRSAECLAPSVGSQLWDYLESRVCLTPLGYDPMLNLISLDDLAKALHAALTAGAQGTYNVPGADTLPLSAVIERCGRVTIPVPGPLLSPLYRLRRATRGGDFRYSLNVERFHFNGVLDGTRAREAFGYTPTHPVDWPTRPASRRAEQLVDP